MNQSSSEQPKTLVTLIDIIFGIIIGASFISFNKILVPLQLDFDIASLAVAFFIITSSWIFWHRAIKTQEIHIEWLIIIDLFLLYVYFYILFSYNNFPHYVAAVCIMFCTYLIWTVFRDIKERKIGESVNDFYNKNKDKKFKLARAIGIFFVSAILLIINYMTTQPDYFSEKKIPGGTDIDIVILILIFLLAVSYRALGYWSEKHKPT